jgi:hypothetical protein
MGTLRQRILGASAGLLLTMTAACSQGGLGDVLGGVLNAPSNQQQLTGTVQGLDTRNQTLFIRQSDGTTVALNYDDRTRVVYQNQDYSVSSLENGDQVTARFQEGSSGNYYTDYVQVTSSVSINTGGGANLNNLSGTVRQIDTYNGWFMLDTQNGQVTVSLPYNPRSADLTRFRNLRNGDHVSLQAVYLNATRYELRQFY